MSGECELQTAETPFIPNSRMVPPPGNQFTLGHTIMSIIRNTVVSGQSRCSVGVGASECVHVISRSRSVVSPAVTPSHSIVRHAVIVTGSVSSRRPLTRSLPATANQRQSVLVAVTHSVYSSLTLWRSAHTDQSLRCCSKAVCWQFESRAATPEHPISGRSVFPRTLAVSEACQLTMGLQCM